MSKTHEFVVYFDGACGPVNPGSPMGFGATIDLNGQRLTQVVGHVPADGDNSNNVAEYLGFTAAVQKLIIFTQAAQAEGSEAISVKFIGDSNMVIQQMAGKWKVKKGNKYTQYAEKARTLLEVLRKTAKLEFEWIDRNNNKEADKLSKEGLDGKNEG
jgi:ribonuclease HI